MTPKRQFGRTRISVSALSLGTDPFALPGCDHALAEEAIIEALNCGIDTIEIDAGKIAMAEWLGGILRRYKPDESINVIARASSAVPFELPSPHVTASTAYPGARLRAEAETLTRLLGVDRLASFQLHTWCPEWLDEGDWLPAMERLRSDGTIAAIGISLFDHDVEAGTEAVSSGSIQSVQAMYNVFDPAAASLFRLSADRGVAVIARSPLYFGALAGLRKNYAADDWRRGYFHAEHARETVRRVEAIGPDSATIALRFAAHNSDVPTVAVGLTKPAHVAEAVAAVLEGPLPPKAVDDLSRHAWLV